MITLKQLHQEALKRPGYKKAYNDLKNDPEFALLDRIIEKRKEEGLTQARLAKKMKTTQSAIARFEAGDANPTLEFLQRLAGALGTEMKITFKDRKTQKV